MYRQLQNIIFSMSIKHRLTSKYNKYNIQSVIIIYITKNEEKIWKKVKNSARNFSKKQEKNERNKIYDKCEYQRES